MPDWLHIVLALGSPFVTILGVFFISGQRLATMQAAIEANAKAIDGITHALEMKVSIDQGKGYQAQIDRLERSGAECEGRISSLRAEHGASAERFSARLSAHEQHQSGQYANLASAFTEIKAMFSAMKESVDRLLEAERARPTTDLVGQLQQFVTLQKMLKGAA